MTAQFVLLLSLAALLDFATPIVPAGQAWEWDEEEEITQIRRQRPRRPLTRVSAVPRTPDVRQVEMIRFTLPAASRSHFPREWMIPPARVRFAPSDLGSRPDDH